MDLRSHRAIEIQFEYIAHLIKHSPKVSKYVLYKQHSCTLLCGLMEINWLLLNGRLHLRSSGVTRLEI